MLLSNGRQRGRGLLHHQHSCWLHQAHGGRQRVDTSVQQGVGRQTHLVQKKKNTNRIRMKTKLKSKKWLHAHLSECLLSSGHGQRQHWRARQSHGSLKENEQSCTIKTTGFKEDKLPRVDSFDRCHAATANKAGISWFLCRCMKNDVAPYHGRVGERHLHVERQRVVRIGRSSAQHLQLLREK